MTFLVLLLTVACGHHRPALSLEPIVITASPALVDVSGLSNTEIVAEAAERRLRGDTDGAIARLNLVIEQQPPPPELPDALYQLGLCHERAERFELALEFYERLVTRHPDASASQDGWFRRALCLEYLGRHRQARRALARVATTNGLDLHDRLTLDLQRGISLVRSGRTRAGLRLMDAALAAADGSDQVTYLRAKSHVTRARIWLEAAERHDLDLRAGRQAAVLELRASHIAAAEKEVAAAAYLGEPEWILEGLLLLGDAYASLHRDLLTSRVPKALDAEGALVYREKVEEQARVLIVKAWNHYDTGVAKAGEWRFVGRPLPQLVSARDAIDLTSLDSEP